MPRRNVRSWETNSIVPSKFDRVFTSIFDSTSVGFLLAGQQSEDRRLAGTVRSDQPDLLSRVQLEGGLRQHSLPAVVLRNALERDHGAGRIAIYR